MDIFNVADTAYWGAEAVEAFITNAVNMDSNIGLDCIVDNPDYCSKLASGKWLKKWFAKRISWNSSNNPFHSRCNSDYPTHRPWLDQFQHWIQPARPWRNKWSSYSQRSAFTVKMLVNVPSTLFIFIRFDSLFIFRRTKK